MSAVHGMMFNYSIYFYISVVVEMYYMGMSIRLGEDKAFLLH